MNKISAFLRRCLFLVLLALVVTLDSAAQEFDQRIVFASNRDGDWDIYSMGVNGDNLVQLTDHPAADEYPACSPDGRRIAFRSERDGTPDLYVMHRDGDNVIRLTSDNSNDSRPSWSPDGTRIAFASSRWVNRNAEIYVMDADGENEINLTNHKWDDVKPSWSPDGSKIAFVAFRDGAADTPRHIFEMNADGTGRRNLTEDIGLTNSSSPSWSPDGSKIAFVAFRDGAVAFEPRHIFVMNADGTGRRNLTEDTGLTNSFSPTWSPDGSKIAFSSRIHWMTGDIYVMTADGEKLERLTDKEGNNRQPAYVRNGTRIAFESNRDGDYKIYLMDTTGRNVVKLTKTPPGIENISSSWLSRALSVNPSGKLSTSWGVLKRAGNPR